MDRVKEILETGLGGEDVPACKAVMGSEVRGLSCSGRNVFDLKWLKLGWSLSTSCNFSRQPRFDGVTLSKEPQI